MKRILLFLCALGLPACGAAAQWWEPYVERVTLADDSPAGAMRETRRDGSGLVRWVHALRHDAEGRLVERERFGPDGAPDPAESVWLDGAGNVVRTVRGVERWSYEDDRHGNWTRKRWLIAPQGGGEPVETYVETREIAYW